MKTLDQFIKDYEGKTVGYPHGSFEGECLSLVKWYIKECFGIEPPPSGCNAARCYWSKFPSPLGTVFKKVSNTPDLVPERGWIAIWDENAGAGYGHIAIVLDATVSRFTSLDQNWGGRHTHKVSHYYKNVYGFLAPISSTQEPMQPNEDLDRILKHFNVKTADELIGMVDKELGFLKDARNTIDSLRGEIEGLKAGIKNEKEGRQNFIDKVADILGSTADESGVIQFAEEIVSNETNALKKVSELEKAYTTLENEKKAEINALRNEVEQLKKHAQTLSDRLEALEKPDPSTVKFITLVDKIIKFFKKGKNDKRN